MFCNKQYWRNAETLLLDCCRNRSIFLFHLVHNQWRTKGATYLCHLAPPLSLDSFMIVYHLFSSFSKQEKIPKFSFGASRITPNRTSHYFLLYKFSFPILVREIETIKEAREFPYLGLHWFNWCTVPFSLV